MKICCFALALACSLAISSSAYSESAVVAEDDASDSAYGSSWDNSKNGGSGFKALSLTSEGNDNERHSGFYIASTQDKQDLNGIAKNGKAFGTYANGSGFEQAVAFRAFEKPLKIGDSFSFMIEDGPFEKKFDKDDPTPGSVGDTAFHPTIPTAIPEPSILASFEIGLVAFPSARRRFKR